jgi:hypothetical protein
MPGKQAKVVTHQMLRRMFAQNVKRTISRP